MRRYKLLEGISFGLLLILALIGTIFIGTALHELSHYGDLHNYVEDSYVCAFVWPTSWDYFKDMHSPLGYYSYDYDADNITLANKVEEIVSHTEVRAYIISGIVLILFFIMMALQIIERMNNKRKSKLLDDLEDEINRNRNI